MFFGKDCFGETDVSKFVVVSPVEFVIWNLWEFVGYKKTPCVLNSDLLKNKSLQIHPRWWFQICFIFTPEIGEDCKFANAFQLG